MLYLSGYVGPDLPDGVGVMVTPYMWNRLPGGRPWAADTGCFTREYEHERYMAWLDARPRTALFATAPDVVGNAEATWALAEPVLPQLRAIGFPAALVAQDGIENGPIEWDAFDALFIGGSTAWKLSEAAYALIAEGKIHGKHVHVGRVNSLRRLRAMRNAGADSCDGTYLVFGPRVNGPRVAAWMAALRAQPPLARAALGEGDGE